MHNFSYYYFNFVYLWGIVWWSDIGIQYLIIGLGSFPCNYFYWIFEKRLKKTYINNQKRRFNLCLVRVGFLYSVKRTVNRSQNQNKFFLSWSFLRLWEGTLTENNNKTYLTSAYLHTWNFIYMKSFLVIIFRFFVCDWVCLCFPCGSMQNTSPYQKH